MSESEPMEQHPQRPRRQPADEMLAEARQSIYELPEKGALKDVSALGESIVDALTTEFSIEEVPAPGFSGSNEASESADEVVAPASRGAHAALDMAATSMSLQEDTAEGSGREAAPHGAHVAMDGDATVAIPRVGAAGSVGRAKEDAVDDDLFDDDVDEEVDNNGPFASADGSPDGSSDDQGGVHDEYPADGVLPDETAAMEPIGEEPPEDAYDEKPRRRRRIPAGKIVAAICILLVLALVGAGVHFAWDRWFRYDDAQDIQGEWQMTNAQRTLVIDAGHLKISEDVAYEYTLDAKHKTITYTFGNASGTASYRFSDDRQVLVIEDNGETDWMMALHLKDDPVLSGSEVPEGTSKLVRLSDDIMATPKSLDDTSDGTEIYEEPFYVGGYTEYSKPEKTKPGSSKKDGEDDEDSDSKDDDDQLEPGQDPNADYFDSERALNFYYDDSQMLYYDQYGNYYYDMYGNNPYEMPIEQTSADTYVEDYAYNDEVYY